MARTKTDNDAEILHPADVIMALGGCWVLLGTIAYFMIATA